MEVGDRDIFIWRKSHEQKQGKGRHVGFIQAGMRKDGKDTREHSVDLKCQTEDVPFFLEGVEGTNESL